MPLTSSRNAEAAAPVRVEPSYPPMLRVTTHAKRLGLTEIRFIHERRRGEPMRVGKITVPRALWLTVYRRMLFWACGERIISLSLDEHASERQAHNLHSSRT